MNGSITTSLSELQQMYSILSNKILDKSSCIAGYSIKLEIVQYEKYQITSAPSELSWVMTPVV